MRRREAASGQARVSSLQRWRSRGAVTSGKALGKTLNAQRSTLNAQRSTLNAQRSTLNAQRCSVAYSLSLKAQAPCSREERADVFAQSSAHGDGEPAVAGDVEVRAGAVTVGGSGAVDRDGAFAGDDLHTLGGAGLEIVGSGADQAECLLGVVRHEHGVAHDVAVEIDIGLGEHRHPGKLAGKQ